MTNHEKGKDLTAAIDKRDWLIARDLAKPGRGKFSNAAKEALAEAEKSGVKFIDKKVMLTSVKTMENGEVVEVKREVNQFAQHSEPIRAGHLTFKGAKGFKLQVNATEACATCLYSLGWCYCKVPTFTYWKTGEVLSIARTH